jgi:hypothetical protein
MTELSLWRQGATSRVGERICENVAGRRRIGSGRRDNWKTER